MGAKLGTLKGQVYSTPSHNKPVPGLDCLLHVSDLPVKEEPKYFSILEASRPYRPLNSGLLASHKTSYGHLYHLEENETKAVSSGHPIPLRPKPDLGQLIHLQPKGIGHVHNDNRDVEVRKQSPT